MKIYLDFDGTVVEHMYPEIGKINPGSLDVIQKLHDAGHEIIINTMRADMRNGTLQQALYFLNSIPYCNIKFEKFCASKVDPDEWVTPNKEMEKIYIDDIAHGIPLRDGFHVGSKMVDWQELNRQFTDNNIY